MLEGNGPWRGVCRVSLVAVQPDGSMLRLRHELPGYLLLWILQLKLLQKVLVLLLSFRNCQLQREDFLVHWSRLFQEIRHFFCVHHSFLFAQDFLPFEVTKRSAAGVSSRCQTWVHKPEARSFIASWSGRMTRIPAPAALVICVHLCYVIRPSKPAMCLRYSCGTNPEVIVCLGNALGLLFVRP